MSPHVPDEEAEASRKEGLAVRLSALARASFSHFLFMALSSAEFTASLLQELLSEAMLLGETGGAESQAPQGEDGAAGPAAPGQRSRSPCWEPPWVLTEVLIKDRVGWKQLPSDNGLSLIHI